MRQCSGRSSINSHTPTLFTPETVLCEVINHLPHSHTPTLFTPETVLWEVVECFGEGLFEDAGDCWDMLLGRGQEASLELQGGGECMW